MSKFSNKDCKFFGARTPESREIKTKCRLCITITPDLYNDCITESNEMLNTSVLLVNKPKNRECLGAASGGDTVIKRFVSNKEIQNKEESPVKTSFRYNNQQIKRVKEKKMVDEMTDNQVTPAQPPAPKVKITNGVLAIAKTMLVAGEATETIMSKLITEYQKAGKTPKQAKHNAQSCLFNARKKLAGNASTTKAVVADPPNDPEAMIPTLKVPVGDGETEVTE